MIAIPGIPPGFLADHENIQNDRIRVYPGITAQEHTGTLILPVMIQQQSRKKRAFFQNTSAG